MEENMRRISIIVLIFSLCAGLIGCQKKSEETLTLEAAEIDQGETHAEENKESTEDTEHIFVYVCGAVNHEGVYELAKGSRVYEAIAMAGGFREDADARNVNQAEVLEDEERIYVPVVGEEVPVEDKKDARININKASKEELMTLPGVGESRAESIIKYREQQGAFQSIEEIMQVSGIKEGLFEKIKDFITI
jgi:competence protein ComEA